MLFACSTAPEPTPIPTVTEQIQVVTPTEVGSATPTRLPTSTNTLAPSKTPAPTSTAIPATATGTPTASILADGCGTVELGEPGTQTRERPEDILVQGTVILCGDVYLYANQFWPIPVPEGMLDLDTGQIGMTEDADIKFVASGGTNMFYYIYGVNEAAAVPWSITLIDGAVVDPPQPTFEDCSSLVVAYANDNEPWFVCVVTGFGNVARIKLEAYNPLGSGALAVEISFITWRR